MVFSSDVEQKSSRIMFRGSSSYCIITIGAAFSNFDEDCDTLREQMRNRYGICLRCLRDVYAIWG